MAATPITTAEFEAQVLKSDVPVLVDFWATWCGPCKMLSPIVAQIAAEANGFKVYSVDVDEEPDLAQDYDVVSIPTLIVFKGGKEAARTVGFTQKEKILAMLAD